MDFFAREGFLVIKDAIDPSAAEKARGLINCALGQERNDVATTKKSTWFPELSGHPALVGLFNNSEKLQHWMQQLIGKRVTQFGAQIALRFPGDLCSAAPDGSFQEVPYWGDFWHVDGFNEPGKIGKFTLLVGIPLQSVLREHAGSLVVFPGSHHDTELFFQEHGCEEAKQRGLEKLQIPLRNAAQQVLLSIGDVVVAHYNLAHSIAPNVSPDIRYQLYFRVDVSTAGSLSNIWQDFAPQLRELGALHRRHAKQEARTLRSTGYIDDQVGKTRVHRDDLNRSLQTADDLFEKQQWDAAAAEYEKAAPTAFWPRFKGAIAQTWASDAAWWKRGEATMRDMLLAYSLFPNLHSCLAQNLMRQEGRAEEAAQLAERCIFECTLAENSDCIRDSLKVLAQANVALGRLQAAKQKARERYPQLELEEGALDAEALWVQGRAWLASPDPKDIPAGRCIFSAIAEVNPLDFWATLLYGGCIMWSGQPVQAEPIIRRALSLNRLVPHAYEALAQCLVQQKKSPLPVISQMLEQRGMAIEDADAEAKMVQLIQLAINCGAEEHRRVACALFPHIAPQLQLLRKKEDCILFYLDISIPQAR